MDKIYKLTRRRVEGQFDLIEETPLTLVVAPMGYGKTTALKLHEEKCTSMEYFWLPLGQSEIEDEVLWQKLFQKLKDRRPDIYERYKDIQMPVEEKDIERLMEILAKAIEVPVAVVIDDYHVSDTAAVNRLLVRLAYADIPNLHLVVLSRVFPRLPYEELMVKGICRLIGQQSLVLVRDEMDEIARKSGILVSKEDMDRIETYTEGWMAAFSIVLVDYRQRKELKLGTGISHMVKTAIYDTLSDDMKRLMMKASLYDDFTAEGLRYAAQEAVEQYELDEIVETTGYLQYDVKSRRYSLNELMKNVAQEELKRSGIDRNILLQRAARWNEMEENYVLAVLYYIRAQDKENVFRILENKARFQTMAVLKDTLEKYLIQVDPEDLTEHPQMALSYVYSLITEGGIKYQEKGKRMFWELKRELEERYCGTEKYNDLKGEIKIVESLMYFSQIERVKDCMKEAYNLREGKPSEYFAGRKQNFSVPDTLMIYHRRPGALRDEARLEQDIADLNMELVIRADLGWKSLVDAEYAYVTGNFDGALEMGQISLEKARFHNYKNVMLISLYVLLRTYIYMGSRAEADKCAQEMRNCMERESNQPCLMEYQQQIGYLAAILGRTSEIPGWLREYRLEECNQVLRSVRSVCMVYGRYLIAKKQWARLEAIAEQMRFSYDGIRMIAAEIMANIYKAVAVKHLQGKPEALEYLKKAIELAKPDGIVMPFAENGEEIIELLEDLAGEKKTAGDLLPYCRNYARSIALFKNKRPVLTKREEQIMKLVREGCTNSEISRKLSIATVTVEKNLTNIYHKLDVTNRTAAIIKYAEFIKE